LKQPKTAYILHAPLVRVCPQCKEKMQEVIFLKPGIRYGWWCVDCKLFVFATGKGKELQDLKNE